MVKRQLISAIEGKFFKGKAIILLGPRQAGKSTMVESMLKERGEPFSYFNGDEADVRQLLSNTTSARLRTLVGQNKIVFIDEAQRIPDIGITMKLFTDQIKEVQVIATGSSAFELSGHVNEPLTGRKYEFMLYPLSFGEMVGYHGLLEEKRLLEHRMVFGYYPEIVENQHEEKELLKKLAASYLYKDLLLLEQIKKPVLLEKLLKALALQLGSEVNYTELGQTVGADKATVEKYIDLLEKAFVLFRVPALNRNVRNEIKKGKKVYFFDCGIRNAIIGNFSLLQNRTDTGALWENFVIAERLKKMAFDQKDASYYFWRTTQQQEIDLIEEYENSMIAFEMKWNERARVRFAQTFRDNYPGAKLEIISPNSIEDLLLESNME